MPDSATHWYIMGVNGWYIMGVNPWYIMGVKPDTAQLTFSRRGAPPFYAHADKCETVGIVDVSLLL